MKKILLTIMLQCFALLFLIFGCGGADVYKRQSLPFGISISTKSVIRSIAWSTYRLYITSCVPSRSGGISMLSQLPIMRSALSPVSRMNNPAFGATFRTHAL